MLVFNAFLSCEQVENLLKSCLGCRVLVNWELLFNFFHNAEHKANRIIITLNFEQIAIWEMLSYNALPKHLSEFGI